MFPRSAIGALVLWLAGCDSVLGIEKLQVGPGDASIDSGPSCLKHAGSGACNACLTTSCCAEIDACASDESCRRSWDCMLACAPGDEKCAAGCVIRLEEKLARAMSCRARSCADACGTSCGGIFGAVRPKHVGKQECVDCYRKEACAQTQAAAVDPSSLLSLGCTWSCPLMDRACRAQCEFRLGPQPVASEAGAAMTKCRTACGEGSDWSCVGNSKYAVGAKLGEVPLNLLLLDNTSRAPFAGVTLRPCTDPACLVPAGRSCVSDEKGYCGGGTISLTNPGPVFGGVIEATGKDVYPTLYFTHPPFSGEFPGTPAFTPFTVLVMTQSVMTAGAALAGAPLIPGRAHAVIASFDCLWAGANDLVLSVSNADEKTAIRYTSGTFVPPDAKVTDASGIALAFNLPPSATPVIVTVKRGEQVVVETPVYIRPDTLSFGLVGPR